MIWIALVLVSVGLGWLLGTGDAAGNLQASMADAPRSLLTALLGLPLGLYGRDRVRSGRTYASPTLAYLGKALLFMSLAAVAAGSLSPLDGPAFHPRYVAVGVAAGMALWLGNLPPRL